MSAAARRAATRVLIRHHAIIGQLRRRRVKLPRQHYPKQIETAYSSALSARVTALIRHAFTPLMHALPDLLARAAAARRLDATRADAGEGPEARALIDGARDRLAAGINASDIEDIASRFAVQTSAYQRTQLDRQTEAGLGIKIGTLGPDPTQHHIVDAFVDSNVALIGGLTDKIAADVQSTIFRAIQDGKPFAAIAGDLQDRFAFGERRSMLIGRDQIGKLYGQINVQRQKQLGVEKFIWVTAGDDKVRDEHAARDGQTYSYDDPPDGELPGEPVLCRCWADPVFDDDFTDEDSSDDSGDEDSGDDSETDTAAPAAEPEQPDEVQLPVDNPGLGDALASLFEEQQAAEIATAEAEEGVGLGRIGVASEISGASEEAVAETAPLVVPAAAPAVAAAEREVSGAAGLQPSDARAPTGYSSFTYGDQLYFQHSVGRGAYLTPAQYAEFEAGHTVELGGPNRQYPGFDTLARKGEDLRFRSQEFIDGRTSTFTAEDIESGKAAKDMQWLRDHAESEKRRR